ncbi:MAG: DNA-directed DNA polymerase II small subunit [Candidatus Thermoplasmatota archaeon]|nr:DNA-directed DNA polymerase II small subunit [Candidatus Thermoplasmatota archaeon]
MRDRIVSELAKNNTVLTPEAMEYLEELEEPSKVIEELTEKEDKLPFPVCKETISCFVDDVLKDVEEKSPGSDRKDRDPREAIEVLKDISGNSTCTGGIDDFSKYFESRFKTLRSIIRERREGKKARPINRIARRAGEASTICMVRDIHSTSNGNKVLTLEDKSGEIRGFISSDSEAYTKNILEDEVILAKGEMWENNGDFEDTFAIEEIKRPDVPKLNDKAKPDFSGRIAFLGDIHVGSSAFLKDRWDDFTSWINSDEAENIRYLIIPGDLIDGIGIFPNQEEELDIIDIHEQYREAARLFKAIRDDLTIITIPGNHDIVRNAEPQPRLPEEIREMFPENVLFFGNPSLIELEGVKILMYHGNSINDLSDMLPQVTQESPITAQREMLKRRHLVPVYGKKTSIAPEEKDHLAIEEVPDIFVTGHIHRCAVDDYHGTVLVNASSWQTQTEYQKMRDIHPEPAKVTILDPKTNKVSIREFN